MTASRVSDVSHSPALPSPPAALDSAREPVLRRQTSRRLQSQDSLPRGGDDAMPPPPSPRCLSSEQALPRPSKSSMLRDSEVSDSTKLRDTLVLLVLWLASTLTFSLMAWFRLAAGELVWPAVQATAMMTDQ